MSTLCTKEPESQPIKSLEELLKWKLNDSACKAWFPLNQPIKSGRKTLVCHDMMGGYLEDRFAQGVCTDQCYQFYQWNCIDIFVYFSHNLVTIPPPGWINAAHKHGIAVLGTFITEWEDGAKVCKNILKPDESYKTVADKLVDVANQFGFDGWLINIENAIEPEQTKNLLEFVKYLAQQTHKCKDNSLVVWYDSVIQSGELKWQNELNGLNSNFFDVCDGIFLNYNWKDEHLKQSASRALEQNRLHDVYVGVDVFGRGCLGGGGYNTKEAIQAATCHNLSVAIFAPGWVYETQDKKYFLQNLKRFWKLLEPYCAVNRIFDFPVVTSFNPGFGKGYYHEGHCIRDTVWSNMSMQHIQPVNVTLHEDEEDGQFNHDWKHVYDGSTSLRLEGNLSEKESLVFSLYNIHLPPEDLFICLTIKKLSRVNVSLVLETECDGKVSRIICGEDTIQERQNYMTVCVAELDDLPEPLAEISKSSHNGWESKVFLIKEVSFLNRTANLSISCVPSDSKEDHCQLLLGQIKILRQKDLPTFLPPVTSFRYHLYSSDAAADSEIKFYPKISLEWKYNKKDASIDNFQIWYKNQTSEDFIFVGSAFCYRYCLTGLQKAFGTNVEVCVRPVHISGIVQSIADAAKIIIQLQ